MPVLNNTRQYGNNVVTHRLSFRFVNTATFDQRRDGRSGVFTNPGGSIVRNSAGLFTITLSSSCPRIYARELTGNVQIEHPAGVPATFLQGWIVKDSYNPTTRSFQIQLLQLPVGAAYVQPAVADPAANDRVVIEFTGSLSSAGTDPT